MHQSSEENKKERNSEDKRERKAIFRNFRITLSVKTLNFSNTLSKKRTTKLSDEHYTMRKGIDDRMAMYRLNSFLKVMEKYYKKGEK